MIKNRLQDLEKKVGRRGVGSHEDYLQAILRVTANIRARIEYRLHGCEGEAPPEADQKDLDMISEYETANHVIPDKDAKRRIEEKLDILHRRIYASLSDDDLRKLADI